MSRATRLRITAKCSDLFSMVVSDDNGARLLEYNGYVPGFMPGEHCGDYVELDIDIATGTILDWPKDAPKRIAKFIREEHET